MRNSTVFSMVSQVLADSREKLAAQESKPHEAGGAAADRMDGTQPMTSGESSDLLAHAEKVAAACDYLSVNLHHVIDQRSPKEKLAEYAAIQEWLAKTGGESDPPMNPPLDDGYGRGGPNSAMQAQPAMTPGGPILHGGDSGQATDTHQPPRSVEPRESPYPTSAPYAFETNLNDPPGGSTPYGEHPTKQAQARKLAALVASGHIRKEAAAVIIKQGMTKQALGYGAASGIGAGVGALGGALLNPDDRFTGALAGGALGAGAGAGGRAMAGQLGARAAGGAAKVLQAAPAAEAQAAHAAQAAAHPAQAAAQGASHMAPANVPSNMAAPPLGRMDLAGLKPSPEMAAQSQHMVEGAGGALEELPKFAKARMLAKTAGVPAKAARALLSKFAEDAINPARISAGSHRIEAGTTPELQSIPGTGPAQMQGSEAGQQVPDTYGDMGGRNLIGSVQAAINATKYDAKHSKTQSQMAAFLREPAMSAAHDNVLNKSLDNASSAGVKIAAARALLERWGNASPANKAKLAAAVKRANAEAGYGGGAPAQAAQAAGAAPAPSPMAGGAGPGSAMPGGMSMPMPGDAKMAMGEDGEGAVPPVSDQALAMAAEGVTPEELAHAHMLLQAVGGEASPTEAPAAPAAPSAEGEPPPVA